MAEGLALARLLRTRVPGIVVNLARSRRAPVDLGALRFARSRDRRDASLRMQQLFGAMHGFARVIAGVTSAAEFFSEENVGRIFAERDERPRLS